MDWTQTVYDSFVYAAETIMEWVLLIVGGICFLLILPILWLYQTIYFKFYEK